MQYSILLQRYHHSGTIIVIDAKSLKLGLHAVSCVCVCVCVCERESGCVDKGSSVGRTRKYNAMGTALNTMQRKDVKQGRSSGCQ